MFLFPPSRTLRWELRRDPESLFPPQFVGQVLLNEKSFLYLGDIYIYLQNIYVFTYTGICFVLEEGSGF